MGMSNLLWRAKPLLRSPDEYIPAVNTARYLESKNRILVIGDAGGRDWRTLSRLGKDIYVLDIAPQENVPNLYIQSIEQRTPFEDEFFDGVVINEVLEHLFCDKDALEEINRILKVDGVLVVTVPYISNVQDVPEWHVRVHSFLTIRRLLERCGFEIEEHFYRGFCCRLPQLGVLPRAAIYLCHKIVEVLTRKTSEEAVGIINGFLDKVERFLGTHGLTIKFQKLFASYGGIMKVRRSHRQRNFDEIQRAKFSNMAKISI